MNPFKLSPGQNFDSKFVAWVGLLLLAELIALRGLKVGISSLENCLLPLMSGDANYILSLDWRVILR